MIENITGPANALAMITFIINALKKDRITNGKIDISNIKCVNHSEYFFMKFDLAQTG